jgi:hypothetical protein
MLTKNDGSAKQIKSEKANTAPILSITKLGVVSRDYQHKFKNGFRDFSSALPDILKLIDDKGCDAVLFSLFSIVPREFYDPIAAFKGLKNVKAVFLEEFQDRNKTRDAGRYVVHHRTSKIWAKYEFTQVFGTLTGMAQKDIDDFVKNEMSMRVLGNCCVLLCGESNGVKYSPKDRKVHDPFGLRKTIPKQTTIILNPIHDRMTRFEMKLKRKFLSEEGRWVVSVWNKGKKDKNGAVRDGDAPAWTAYYNGQEISISPIEHSFQKIEIGILNVAKA